MAKVSGTSGNSDGTYQVILDDIAAPAGTGTSTGFKFMDFNQPAQTDMTFQQDERGFASFIPGENIFVYAQVFNNEALSQVKTSNIESGSSSLRRSVRTEARRLAASAIWKIWMSGFQVGIRLSCTLGR